MVQIVANPLLPSLHSRRLLCSWSVGISSGRMEVTKRSDEHNPREEGTTNFSNCRRKYNYQTIYCVHLKLIKYDYQKIKKNNN